MHFVGIGGIGMSGIAELLVNLGYEVSGSDQRRSEVTDRLASLGVRVFEGHDARHVGEAEVVIVSSAVRPANAELLEAHRRQIPVIPRAEMLAELMRLRYSIAIAGAHGKTSTTSMVALVLERAGLDPTAIIGGRLSAFGSNARLGGGNYVVAEADESDRSFLKLSPTIAVITNVDREHLESYESFDHLLQAFVDFANKVPFYGAVVLCADDARLRSLTSAMTRRVVTYGLATADADVYGHGVELAAFGARCGIRARVGRGAVVSAGSLELRVPGRHNLLNGLAAVAVGMELGLSLEQVLAALGEFRGVERRFELRGEIDDVLVVDDYAHHPTEIAAALATARDGLGRRVVAVFQPHRYSRTRDLMDAFGPALAGAAEIVLTDIYGAGEDPLVGVEIDTLAAVMRRATRVPVHVVRSLDDVPAVTARLVRPGDVVLTLGAGSVGTVVPRILAELQARGFGTAIIEDGAGASES